MSSLLVINIAQAVSGSAAPARGRKMRELVIHAPAAIYAREGVIQAVGPQEMVEKEVSDDPVVLDVATVIRVVDSHTHLVFGGSARTNTISRSPERPIRRSPQRGAGSSARSRRPEGLHPPSWSRPVWAICVQRWRTAPPPWRSRAATGSIWRTNSRFWK